MEINTNTEILLNALKYLNPCELSYDDWFHIGTALKTENIDFEVWNNWSKQDKARYDHKEMDKKWKSFKVGTVNGGTLITIAQQHGYTGPTGRPIKKANNKNVSKTQKESILLTKKEQDTLIEDIKNACLKLDYADNVKNYLKQRGITLETAITYGVGASVNDNLFIPTSTNHIERYITDENTRYHIPKNTHTGLFNENIIEASTTEPIYVCEGAIDALSVLQEGYKALATNSTSNIMLFVNKYEEKHCKAPIVLCMDNDQSGIEAKEKLKKELDRIKASYVSITYPGDIKDINEWYTTNKEQLQKELKRMNQATQEEREKEVKAYKNTSSAYLLEQLGEQFKAEPISTGFKQLDYVLSGGLYDGLYILGAETGQGKTTYALQICDNIAKSGHDVLIFSLEMSASELIARSISRTTYEISTSIQSVFSDTYAKSEIEIRRIDLYKTYAAESLEVIEQAKEKYKEYAKNIYIIEGIGNISATTIKEAIEKHKELTGNKPVVLVDYIQLLAPNDNRYTEIRESIDKNILELKRITRDMHLPIIAISSMNRSSYNAKASNSSFKESGSIEYTATVTMQLTCESEDENNTNARDMELTILKNRQGIRGKKIKYEYNSKYNSFKEQLDQNNQKEEIKKRIRL